MPHLRFCWVVDYVGRISRVENIQQRKKHWVIADLVGKGESVGLVRDSRRSRSAYIAFFFKPNQLLWGWQIAPSDSNVGLPRGDGGSSCLLLGNVPVASAVAGSVPTTELVPASGLAVSLRARRRVAERDRRPGEHGIRITLQVAVFRRGWRLIRRRGRSVCHLV